MKHTCDCSCTTINKSERLLVVEAIGILSNVLFNVAGNSCDSEEVELIEKKIEGLANLTSKLKE